MTITLGAAFRKLWHHLAGHRARLVVVILLSMGAAQLAVLGPALTAQFFGVFGSTQTPQGAPPPDTLPAEAGSAENTSDDNLLTRTIPMQVSGIQLSDSVAAWVVLVLAIVATIGTAVLNALVALTDTRLRQRVNITLKAQLYRRIHDRHVAAPFRPVGELLRIVTSQAGHLLAMVQVLYVQPAFFGFMFITAVATMLRADVPLTLVYLAALLVVSMAMPAMFKLDRRVAKAALAMRDAAMSEANVLQEQLAARDLVDALRLQQAATDRAQRTFGKVAHAEFNTVFAGQLRELTSPLAAITFPVIVLIGVSGVIGQVSIATLATLILLYPAVRMATDGLVSQWAAWHQSAPEFALLVKELEAPVPPKRDDKLFDNAPAIAVRNLTAVLPDGKKIIDGGSASFEAGKLTAIVGRGGTGKSLLLDVIAGRFTGTLGGELQFNGTTAPADEMIFYRDQIARLNQFPQLLQISVHEFLWFGVEGEHDVAQTQALLDKVGLGQSAPATRRLNPQDRIGIDRRLSGFQSQAVRVAQILARPQPRPGVVLFDEPDSSMSPEDATAIQRIIIENLTPASTVLLVTHAPQLLPAGQQILFLRDEWVTGTHGELLKKSPHYKQLVADLAEDTPDPAEGSPKRAQSAGLHSTEH